MFMTASGSPGEMLAASVQGVQTSLDFAPLRRFRRQVSKYLLPKRAGGILVAGVLLRKGLEEHAFKAFRIYDANALRQLNEFGRQFLTFDLDGQHGLGIAAENFLIVRRH